MENEERMKTENGRRTDGLCLYVKKKTFLGQNTKSYFYVKMTYVFMFLCFWECSINLSRNKKENPSTVFVGA